MDELNQEPIAGIENRSPNLVFRSLLLLGVAVLTIAVCAFLIIRRQNRVSTYKRKSGTVAHVLDTYSRSSGGNGGSTEVDDVIVDYEFTVAGREYRTNVKLSSKTGRLFSKGQDATVCYDPENPADSEIFAAGYSCTE